MSSASEERAEANGTVFMAGTFFIFIGVWVVWSFGYAMLTFGTLWIAASLFAAYSNGDDTAVDPDSKVEDDTSTN